MPRFFFNFVCQSSRIPDDEGKELASVKEAHRYAVLLIKQAICDFEAAADWRDWRIQITEASDLPLLTVLFPSRSPDVAMTTSTSLTMQAMNRVIAYPRPQAGRKPSLTGE